MTGQRAATHHRTRPQGGNVLVRPSVSNPFSKIQDVFLREDDPDAASAMAPQVVACAYVFPLAADLQLLPSHLEGRSIDEVSDEDVAALLSCHRQLLQQGIHRLGSMFPVLYRCADEALAEELLGTRAWNALRRKRVVTWGHLCSMKATDLLVVPNFGITSLLAVADASVAQSISVSSTIRHEASPADDRARAGARLPSGRIGELRPHLRSLRLEVVPNWLIPTRLRSALGDLSWERLLEVDVGELTSRANVGERSVLDLLERLADLTPGDAAASSVSDVTLRELYGPLGSLLAWGRRERGIGNVGDLLTINPSQDPMPSRVRQEWQRLASQPIAGGTELDVCDLVEGLLSTFDERELQILRLRVWGRGGGPTLEAIGEDAGLTRERVRQLQVRCSRELRDRLNGPRLAPIVDRAEELQLRLGMYVRLDSERYAAALSWALRDISPDLLSDAELLFSWLAGPYTEHGGWAVSGGGTPIKQIRAQLEEVAGDDGFLSEADLRTELGRFSIHDDQHSAWMESFGRFQRLDDGWFCGGQNVIDAAVRLLRLRGRPMSAEEILEDLDRDASLRSVRQRLFEDDRVHRVTKSRFALREWAMDEYTSVAQEMVEEIERSGGSVPIDELVQRLAVRHDISPASVRMYAGRPMFRVDAAGVISVRDEGSYEVGSDLAATPGCYEIAPGVASWRVRVDGEILRGSGRRVPEPLAGWLGLRPGSQREWNHSGGTMLLSWTAWGQPTIGSLRSFVDQTHGQVGDWLVLVFRPGDALEVQWMSDDVEVDFGRVADLVGVEWRPGDPLQALARLLAIEEGADNLAFRVRGSLARRGDEDLVALVDRIMFG